MVIIFAPRDGIEKLKIFLCSYVFRFLNFRRSIKVTLKTSKIFGEDWR